MKIYREWVYKIMFFTFCQVAAHVSLLLTGDIFYKGGVEFDIEIKEIE